MQYLSFDENTWCVDVETDGLRPTVVWVLVASNMVTGETVVLTDQAEMRQWVDDRRAEGGKFVGHNFLHFDGPVLNNLVGTRLSQSCVVDTFILSCLFNPSLKGGHSLDAWGERLRFPKLAHDEWHVLSPEMIERCKGDVEITKRLYGFLCRKLTAIGFSERSCALEHYAWVIVRKQQINGFAFDSERAEAFYAELMKIADGFAAELQMFFPPVLTRLKTYKAAYKKDGSESKQYQEHFNHYKELRVNPDGTYEAWDYVAFDPASPQQRVTKLLALGWEPKEFTEPSDTHPNGQPQPTRKGKLVPSLVAFVEAQTEETGVRVLADWMVVNSRASMIKTWINSVNKVTGRIHGQLWLANTLRYKHSAPNTANAPSVKEGPDGHALRGEPGGWAYESRDLWETRDRDTRRLVGVDAKGIQLRVLANYLDDADFTQAILSEDPHDANAKMMGLPNRSIAKTITYAIVMGAGDQKIADTARITLKEAKANKAKFFAKVPGLKKLIARLKGEQGKDERITLCDGARIIVSQEHTVIPYLLQGDESCIMKTAMYLVDTAIRKHGLDALQVGFIHDELQFDVAEEDVEAFTSLLPACFAKAGRVFDYKVPVECDFKVGYSWSQTH